MNKYKHYSSAGTGYQEVEEVLRKLYVRESINVSKSYSIQVKESKLLLFSVLQYYKVKTKCFTLRNDVVFSREKSILLFVRTAGIS